MNKILTKPTLSYLTLDKPLFVQATSFAILHSLAEQQRLPLPFSIRVQQLSVDGAIALAIDQPTGLCGESGKRDDLEERFLSEQWVW